MSAFDAYDPAADLLNVLRADRAGQELAVRLRLCLAGEVRERESRAPTRPRRAFAWRGVDGVGPGRRTAQHDATPGGALGAWGARLDSMVRAGLKARLLHGDGVFTTADPDGLSRFLESSHRFRRDTRLGSVFHRRRVSFREVVPTDSLHVVIDGNTVSSHIDRVSPLNCDPDRKGHYSPNRIVAHNAAGIVDDLLGRLAGRGARPRPKPKGTDHGAGDPQIPAGHGATTIAFSVIDEAVHLLDTEAAPWSIQLEIGVRGSIDPDRLRDAVVEAADRHPMARARKRPSRRTLHWDSWDIPDHMDVDPLRVTNCPDEATLIRARTELHGLAVPLGESPPLRMCLAQRRDGDILMINVNHAAMDGFGALRVVRSIARAYAGDDDTVGSDDPDARDLARALAAPDTSTRLRRHLVLLEKWRDLIAPPARLAPDAATGDTGYGFHHVTVPAAATNVLIEHRHQGTVNDVLVAALHQTIAGWNTSHQAPCGRITVLVPANLRPHHLRDDLVGNFSLPARITTNRRHRRHPLTTLAKVTDQTSRKKRTIMGSALIEVLGASRRLPLWAKQTLVMLLPVTGNRMIDTAMLSNLGVLTDVPSFGRPAGDVTEVWFSPPARMPLGLTIGAVTVAGRLHLSFRYRHRQFAAGAAARFAGLYIDQLQEIVLA